jgi:uncharacterized protein YlxP (DUF503 family)
MAKTVNKTTYINTELEWAEEQLQSWKEYIDTHPLHTMTDRMEWKVMANGGTLPIIIASIEAQGKFIQETMKNYLALLEVVDNLRSKEETKIEVRGKAKLGTQAQQFLDNRNK